MSEIRPYLPGYGKNNFQPLYVSVCGDGFWAGYFGIHEILPGTLSVGIEAKLMI